MSRNERKTAETGASKVGECRTLFPPWRGPGQSKPLTATVPCFTSAATPAVRRADASDRRVTWVPVTYHDGLLKRSPTSAVSQALVFFLNWLSAFLQFETDTGLVHEDHKRKNTCLREDGQVFIFDFENCDVPPGN